ncbi:glucose-6-phosphate dehydrogenase [Rubrobacter taiwanensis]|uniref:Glucose-6-phosphate 1-dehydrogenase n=1 Tax=Rubrobacter taiwanensis TaxID=185139 RepID=A0A4R1BRA6_9ACTN|nr:glucose-6-phosphate dehydrogenase [Rubrobacter taiwanensis]TCJ19837.1 glucose-6-phosphate dehydrogenase [Rubrobacter taiwanensis]
MIRRLAIFGAAGDLTARYLLPALVKLHETGRLPGGFQILGIGRNEWDTESYRREIEGRVAELAPELPEASRKAVAGMLEYRRADATRGEEVAQALRPLDEPVAAYLALPPAIFAPVVEALADAGLPEGSRVVIEKPFGEDLESAQRLNRLLHDTFSESAVFRVDHFLAMQTVQNLLGLRFANRVFEPLWNREHIDKVEIVWEETLALEGRASYYDSAGALKDMIQNHLLQLLCLVGMEPPHTLNERDLRDRKVELLRAVRRLSPEEVERNTVRARYSAGRIGDREIPAYADEEGVDPENGTETFAQVTLGVENWRWKGVPFVLRTGKALSADRREILIRFRPVPHLAFGQEGEPLPDALRILLTPERIELEINVNGPGDPFELERTTLEAGLAPHELPAYGHVLLAALEGDSTLSIRADEAEESWRIVEPILQSWAKGRPQLLEYPAGSGGP